MKAKFIYEFKREGEIYSQLDIGIKRWKFYAFIYYDPDTWYNKKGDNFPITYNVPLYAISNKIINQDFWDSITITNIIEYKIGEIIVTGSEEEGLINFKIDYLTKPYKFLKKENIEIIEIEKEENIADYFRKKIKNFKTSDESFLEYIYQNKESIYLIGRGEVKILKIIPYKEISKSQKKKHMCIDNELRWNSKNYYKLQKTIMINIIIKKGVVKGSKEWISFNIFRELYNSGVNFFGKNTPKFY